jgi:hypothetical protein
MPGVKGIPIRFDRRWAEVDEMIATAAPRMVLAVLGYE